MLAIAIALLFATTPTGASASTPVAVSTSVDQADRLQLKLEPNKSKFVLFEPIVLPYRITNPTTQPIVATLPGIADPNWFEFFVKDDNGHSRKYPATVGSCKGTVEIPYSPGIIRVAQADIDGFWIDTPGKYRVTARMAVGYQRGRSPSQVYIESNTVEVEVKSPSEIDVEAISALGSQEKFRRLMQEGAAKYCQGRSGPECFEELNSFLLRFSGSAYAPIITLELAESVAAGSISVTPKYDLAVNLFKGFIKQWPEHPSVANAMYHLARILDEAGRYDEAGKAIGEYEKRFPDRKDEAGVLRKNLESGLRLQPEPK